ncbi:hypothetical protein PpBr36_08782 [Pyricularia pennisetigena]|uniref:hypothetical protein n=1 Tax=Pyricularia pennisetigena TaxID=1578925 RepID=UPI00114E4D70|nr:hypothetical protein PpBr36_08782 [Pyricularia pennisetigena]TLS23829.1 hypothetical protein PpBr36_08782 [Pyricularia pennisetigena]
MSGLVRPARGGLSAQNKVTKPQSSSAARRQNQNHHQQQLLTAAVLEQQHQANQTNPSIHHSLGAPSEDTEHLQLHHPQLQSQHQHHLAIHHDPLVGAGLDDPSSHTHAHPHDLHEDHHHSIVDLDLPETDDNHKPDHTTLHDPSVAKVPTDVDTQLTQSMDLSGPDGSLLDGNSSLLDDGGAAYDSPPADSPPDHQSVDATSVAHHQHHAINNFDTSMRSTGDMARVSGYNDYKIESALAKRLYKEPGMRPAQQRRPEQMLNLQRRSNVEALFAHIAGVEAPSPCKNCRKGHETRTGQGTSSSLHTTQQHPGNHSMQTPSAPSPHDTYGVGSPLNLAPQSHNGLPGTMNFNSSAMNGNMNHSGGSTQDAAVRLTLERSLQELRNADRKQRQLLKIELTTKQLALQIVEYEDMVAHEGRLTTPTKSPHRLWGQAGIPATPASTVEGAFRKARPRSSRQKKPKKQENQENPQRVLLQYQEQQEEQKDSSYLCDPLLFQSSYQDFDYQQHHGTLKFYQPLTPLSDGQYFDQQQEANFDFYELITFHNSEYLDPELALC